MRRRAAAVSVAVGIRNHSGFSSRRGGSGAPDKSDLGKVYCCHGTLRALRGVKTVSYHSVSHTFLRSLSASDSPVGFAAYESKDGVRPLEKTLTEKSSWQWTESATENVSKSTISPEGGFIERKTYTGQPNVRSLKRKTEGTKGEGDEDECRTKRFAPFNLSRLSIFFLNLIISGEL